MSPIDTAFPNNSVRPPGTSFYCSATGSPASVASCCLGAQSTCNTCSPGSRGTPFFVTPSSTNGTKCTVSSLGCPKNFLATTAPGATASDTCYFCFGTMFVSCGNQFFLILNAIPGNSLMWRKLLSRLDTLPNPRSQLHPDALVRLHHVHALCKRLCTHRRWVVPASALPRGGFQLPSGHVRCAILQQCHLILRHRQGSR